MGSGDHEELNAMELNTNSTQAACCDVPENQLHTMETPKLDNETSHCVEGKQDISVGSWAVADTANLDLAPIKLATQAVNVLNGEYCGLFTQLSIDQVDIFEILREEILAAEARELEMSGLLDAGEELEESSKVEGHESTSMTDIEGTGIDRHDCEGETRKRSFHDTATDVADAASTSQKGGYAQTEIPRSPSVGLVEDAFLKEVAEMGAEDEAAPLEDSKGGCGDQSKLIDVRDTGFAEGNYRVLEDVKHVETSITPSEGGFVQACQHEAKVVHEENLPPSNVQMNGDAFAKEDDTNNSKETLLDSSKGGDGDHLMQNDTSDKVSEYSEDDDYTSSPFSGPIAFSGMLSYSGLIPYSGQIPHSGNMSLHSDSSTSTRSFAFPILASDWNSSPAKIGQPDSRFFRRRRSWRLRFCCRRPATLFD